MTSNRRLDPAVRTAELLSVALEVASARGWRQMTRDCIAVAAGVSPALVSARLGTMDALRRSVMRAAVKQRVVSVVAEGLAVGDAQARKASDELKRLAADHLCK
jgi:AcrR family transcriptional regulator